MPFKEDTTPRMVSNLDQIKGWLQLIFLVPMTRPIEESLCFNQLDRSFVSPPFIQSCHGSPIDCRDECGYHRPHFSYSDGIVSGLTLELSKSWVRADTGFYVNANTTSLSFIIMLFTLVELILGFLVLS